MRTIVTRTGQTRGKVRVCRQKPSHSIAGPGLKHKTRIGAARSANQKRVYRTPAASTFCGAPGQARKAALVRLLRNIVEHIAEDGLTGRMRAPLAVTVADWRPERRAFHFDLNVQTGTVSDSPLWAHT